jgi:hypothetical protein
LPAFPQATAICQRPTGASTACTQRHVTRPARGFLRARPSACDSTPSCVTAIEQATVAGFTAIVSFAYSPTATVDVSDTSRTLAVAAGGKRSSAASPTTARPLTPLKGKPAIRAWQTSARRGSHGPARGRTLAAAERFPAMPGSCERRRRGAQALGSSFGHVNQRIAAGRRRPPKASAGGGRARQPRQPATGCRAQRHCRRR